MNTKTRAPWVRGIFLALLCLVGSGLTGCFHLNVVGRDIPDSEYRTQVDEGIAREKRGLPPEGAHDEHGRPIPWDEYWCGMAGATLVPPSAQSHRIRRYIAAKRRAAGLPELTCAGR